MPDAPGDDTLARVGAANTAAKILVPMSCATFRYGDAQRARRQSSKNYPDLGKCPGPFFRREDRAMHNHDEDSSSNLDDRELLAKESMQRDEVQRLEREQPQLRDTTYGLAPGSRPL